MNIWQTFLYQPLLNGLILFYQLFNSVGWSIIGLTLVLRLVLLPLTLPTLKSAQKMKELAPKLEKLKKKYSDDKQKLAQAQMDLYRTAGVKPFAGFLPQIIQIVILIALYQAFRQVLGDGSIEKLNQMLYQPLKLAADTQLNLKFLYLDLAKPDFIRIAGRKLPGLFLIIAAAAQYLSARLMMPQTKKQKDVAKKTEAKSDDFAAAMQTQSLYIFPLMTLLIGLSFPSGLILYWLVFSVFNLVQQLLIKRQQNNGQN